MSWNRIKPAPSEVKTGLSTTSWARLGLFCWILLLGGSAAASAAPGGGTLAQGGGAYAAVETLIRQESASRPGKLHLDVDLSQLQRRPACNRLTAFKPGGFRLRPRMTVGLQCEAPERWTAYASVRAQLEGVYPIAARTLDAGETLTPQSYVIQAGDLMELPADTITDQAQLRNLSARQRIIAGQPLRAGALRSANAVLRGHAVRLVLHGHGFTITRDGALAMEDGNPGSTIQVRTSAGQVVSGIVDERGTVEVQFP